jgi:hypothetical protein
VAVQGKSFYYSLFFELLLRIETQAKLFMASGYVPDTVSISEVKAFYSEYYSHRESG